MRRPFFSPLAPDAETGGGDAADGAESTATADEAGIGAPGAAESAAPSSAPEEATATDDESGVGAPSGAQDS